jgi:FkbM family methyltransferase
MDEKIQYYSQCDQDRILDENVFKHLKNGVFIDVGAHDGISFNNTLSFEKYHGWSGVCIEPLPDVFKELLKNRRTICIQCAVSNESKPKSFMKIKGHGEMLSGLAEHYHPNHLQRINQEVAHHGGSKELIMVPCQTLEEIFTKHNIKHVNYLSIDVEGGESNVIHSINFDNVFIDVIDLENNYEEVTLPILKYLETKGYSVLQHIQWDIILIHKDSEFNRKATTKK